MGAIKEKKQAAINGAGNGHWHGSFIGCFAQNVTHVNYFVQIQKKPFDGIKGLSSEVWVSPSALLGFQDRSSLPNSVFTKGLI